MGEKPYGVYAKIDDRGRITEINSDAFLSSLEGWVKIAEGWGDKHHHAQGNFLDKPIFADNGVFQYKFENGEVVERTPDEISGDLSTVPQPSQQVSIEKRMEALEKAVSVIQASFEVFKAGK